MNWLVRCFERSKEPRSFRDVETWKRGVAMFSVITLASSGLCGLNAGVSHFIDLDRAQKAHDFLAALLIGTGVVESIGMVFGFCGLLVSLLGWILQSILHRK